MIEQETTAIFVSAGFDCVVDRAYDAGDHTIFVGRVVACHAGDEDASPLVFHNTRYAQLVDLGDTGA